MPHVTGSTQEQHTISAAEFEEFRQLKVELRQRRVSDTVKAMGSIKANTLRQRIAMRRADIKTLAPDEDLVAYSSIYKLKNPTADPKLKTYVTDNEISAYKELDPEFNKVLTMADVSAKVAELKKLGKLSTDGDNAGDSEDTAESGDRDE